MTFSLRFEINLSIGKKKSLQSNPESTLFPTGQLLSASNPWEQGKQEKCDTFFLGMNSRCLSAGPHDILVCC